MRVFRFGGRVRRIGAAVWLWVDVEVEGEVWVGVIIMVSVGEGEAGVPQPSILTIRMPHQDHPLKATSCRFTGVERNLSR